MCGRLLSVVLLTTTLYGTAASAGDDAGERRRVEAVWLFYATLISLEQESPAGSWRWLRQELGLGPEQAGTLLAFSIEAMLELSALADALHAQNCAQLTGADPTLDDVARAIEETNETLAAFRRDKVEDMADVVAPATKPALMALVQDEFLGAVSPPDIDVRGQLEATGEPARVLVNEMCAPDP